MRSFDPREPGAFYTLSGDLAETLNARGLGKLGDLNKSALTATELLHIEAVTAVAVAQANSGDSRAFRKVMVFDCAEPEFDLKLEAAVKAGYIDLLSRRPGVYRVNRNHLDLPKRAYPNYSEWQYLV